MDTKHRTLAKALTWRAIAVTITTTVVWAMTGKLELGATVGVFDSIIKIGAYYLHERAWHKVALGRATLGSPDGDGGAAG